MKQLTDDQLSIEISTLWRVFDDNPKAALEMAIRAIGRLNGITGEAQPEDIPAIFKEQA